MKEYQKKTIPKEKKKKQPTRTASKKGSKKSIDKTWTVPPVKLLDWFDKRGKGSNESLKIELGRFWGQIGNIQVNQQ